MMMRGTRTAAAIPPLLTPLDFGEGRLLTGVIPLSTIDVSALAGIG
jgi:hypothetical protein